MQFYGYSTADGTTDDQDKDQRNVSSAGHSTGLGMRQYKSQTAAASTLKVGSYYSATEF